MSIPGLSVALVSDGHGGTRYFRSDVGSKLACEVSKELIEKFVEQIDPMTFKGFGLTQSGVNGEFVTKEAKNQFEALRRLGGSIISTWRQKITKHAQENPLTDQEKESVPAEYHDQLQDEEKIAKVYGCTLIAYVQTPEYWFAFQIGDGKCFSFHPETGPKQPILWDEACFLNKTTSLCDSNAFDKFRYTFEGDGRFPYAVLLGSDGLDDSFGEDKNLINFYIQVLKLAYASGIDELKQVLEKDLPTLSQRGSQDDMSIAGVIDETSAQKAIAEFTEWQLNTVLGELNQNKARIHKFHKERKSLIDIRTSNQKAAIDYDYAVKEILASIDARKRLIDRHNALAKELDADNPNLFIDDIPYEKVIPAEDPIQSEDPVQPEKGVQPAEPVQMGEAEPELPKETDEIPSKKEAGNELRTRGRIINKRRMRILKKQKLRKKKKRRK